MYSIAICDDNDNERVVLRNFVEKSFGLINKKIVLKQFRDGTKLLESGKIFDIVFLDILYGDDLENGIKIAKKLKENNYDLVIVLISSSNDFLQEGYKIKATRYLLKPLNFSSFHQDICEIVDDLEFNQKRVYLPSINSFVFLHQVLVVEKINRKICVHSKIGPFEEHGTFDEWIKKINDNLFSVSSRGIYINLRHVKTINGTNVELMNGQVFPLSRRLKRTFREKWYKFIGENV